MSHFQLTLSPSSWSPLRCGPPCSSLISLSPTKTKDYFILINGLIVQITYTAVASNHDYWQQQFKSKTNARSLPWLVFVMVVLGLWEAAVFIWIRGLSQHKDEVWVKGPPVPNLGVLLGVSQNYRETKRLLESDTSISARRHGFKRNTRMWSC